MLFISTEEIKSFFFSNWVTIFRILLVGTLIYLSVVVILRLFGKRALAKMNAFDFVVTIALGSILSTTIVNKNLALVDGALVILLLLLLQFALSKLAMVSTLVNGLIKEELAVLFYKNQFDYTVMKKQRVLEGEIYQAMRAKGFSSTNNVLAVVLETTGDISVLPKDSDFPENSTLTNLSLTYFDEHHPEKNMDKEPTDL